MFEFHWGECKEPGELLEFLGLKASERKLRLLCCAFVRRAWHLLRDERSKQAVEALERYADGDGAKLAIAISLSREVFGDLTLEDNDFVRDDPTPEDTDDLPGLAAYYVCHEGRWSHTECAFTTESAEEVAKFAALALGGGPAGEASERLLQAGLIRCVFRPFRPVTIDPAWLTADVVRLARAAYDERILPSGELEQHRLAVLADALEDAGCASGDILAHLRGPGSPPPRPPRNRKSRYPPPGRLEVAVLPVPHIRGCWVIDALRAGVRG